MAITAAMVKELREISGAGMMDCKKALTATEGDMDKAMEFLREKGLATAPKNSRHTLHRLLSRLWKQRQQISMHSWLRHGNLIQPKL